MRALRAVGVALLGLLLATGLAAEAGPAQEPGQWLVTRDGLNLRAAPDTDAPVLVVMPPGARVEVAGPSSGEWVSVRYHGQTGYAARAYLAAAPSGPFSLNLPVPFYRQLTAVWCDPAAIQSWLPTQCARPRAAGYSL